MLDSILLIIPMLLYGLSTLIQGFYLFFNKSISESKIRFFSQWISILAISSSIASLLRFLKTPQVQVLIMFHWLELTDFHIPFQILFSQASVIYSLLSSVLLGIILKFSFSYLHRDPGFNRFFLLIHLLGFSTQLLAISGTWDEWFMGWELTGIASVFLIQFFNTEKRPVQNSFRAFINYRICDAFLLAAIALIHHYKLPIDFSGHHYIEVNSTTQIIGLFIIMGTLAKSAQFPLSQWLRRAIEGPTASSAIFYGALSIHLGPLLLLRSQEIWFPHQSLRLLVATIGLLTWITTANIARVRADIKSVLANATATQVGLIYIELALGWNHLALIHLVFNASLKTWQFLRSSSLIHDFFDDPLVKNRLTNLKIHSFYTESHSVAHRTLSFKRWFYITALNEFYIESIERALLIRPLFAMIDFFKSSKFLSLIFSVFGVFWSLSPYSDKPGFYFLTFAFLVFTLIKALGSVLFLELTLYLICAQSILILGFFDLSQYPITETLIPLFIFIFPMTLLIIGKRKMPSFKSSFHFFEFKGFQHSFPIQNRLFLVFGLMNMGLPFSLSYWAEDHLFHRMLQQNAVFVFPLILYLVAAPIAFFKAYFSLFTGPVPNKTIDNTPALSKPYIGLAYLWIMLQFVFGFFPQWFFRLF